MTPAETVRALWERLEARDWDGARATLADGFVCDYPHTGERFGSPDAFIAMNRLPRGLAHHRGRDRGRGEPGWRPGSGSASATTCSTAWPSPGSRTASSATAPSSGSTTAVRPPRTGVPPFRSPQEPDRCPAPVSCSTSTARRRRSCSTTARACGWSACPRAAPGSCTRVSRWSRWTTPRAPSATRSTTPWATASRCGRSCARA